MPKRMVTHVASAEYDKIDQDNWRSIVTKQLNELANMLDQGIVGADSESSSVMHRYNLIGHNAGVGLGSGSIAPPADPTSGTVSSNQQPIQLTDGAGLHDSDQEFWFNKTLNNGQVTIGVSPSSYGILLNNATPAAGNGPTVSLGSAGKLYRIQMQNNTNAMIEYLSVSAGDLKLISYAAAGIVISNTSTARDTEISTTKRDINITTGGGVAAPASPTTLSLEAQLNSDLTLDASGSGDLTISNTGTGIIAIDSGDDNTTIDTASTGAITLTSAGSGAIALDATSSGDVTISNTGTGIIAIDSGNDNTTIDTTSTGAIVLTSAGSGAISLDATGSGNVTIDASGTGLIAIDSGNDNTTIDTTSTGAILLTSAGSGNIALDATGTNDIRLDASASTGFVRLIDQILFDGTSDLSIDTTGAGVVISATGDDISLQAIGSDLAINSSGTNGVDISGSSSSKVLIHSADGNVTSYTTGSGDVELHANGTGNIDISTTSGAGIIALDSGSGNMTIDASGAGSIAIDSATSGDVALTATGTGDVRINGTRFLTGSKVIDFATAAGGGPWGESTWGNGPWVGSLLGPVVLTDTITVTGAEDGDPVLLGYTNSADIDFAIYTAFVSAPDTVTVKFDNYSDIVVNPASGTFNVVVFNG